MFKLKKNFAVFTTTKGFLREDTCVRPQGMAVQSCSRMCVATQGKCHLLLHKNVHEGHVLGRMINKHS